MKNILIIYPHWPPSNLAGVHRPRLLANFLPEFGWHPIVLTVDSKFYEETLDPDMCKLVSDKVEVHYVNAFKVSKKFRLIGDIGLRGFFQLWKGARDIIKKQKIDFIFIPIPAYYTALLGRFLFEQFKIPYGIDYIDPWTNGFSGSKATFSKAWIVNSIAKILEPFSVKKASLISGVSTPYYQYVLDNYLKEKKIAHVGMPYGFDPNDHIISLKNIPLPWDSFPKCKPLLYAGIFLPNSHLFIINLFKVIRKLIDEKKWDNNIHLFFIGTASEKGKSIHSYALHEGIEEFIHEDTNRYPYLQVLNFLSNSFGVMVIGSTEKHYTASKTFQALLSKRPVFAILHEESSAVKVMEEVNASAYLVCYKKDNDLFLKDIESKFNSFINPLEKWIPNLNILEKFSSHNSAFRIVEKLNEILN